MLDNLTEKIPEAERVYRAKRITKWIYDIAYYGACSVNFFNFIPKIYALVFFKDESWFPGVFGGVGECKNLFKEFPDYNLDANTSLKFYLII